MSVDDITPTVERRALIRDEESEIAESTVAKMSSLSISNTKQESSSPIIVTPCVGIRTDETDMSQSYHEIFDTQGYISKSKIESPETPASVNTPGTETGSDSVGSNKTETGQTDTGVYYNEGEGRLESCSPPAATPMSQYLTSKLVADSLMWQQTFRNDSPSPDELEPCTRVPNDPDSAARPRKASCGSEIPSSVPSSPRDLVADPMVLNDIEKEARRLATDVDSLVENLSCVLQSVSALTVETVQTYRDGVCKTCDEVDSNIRAMYQLMAKWEELNKNMAPAYKVSSQIKDIIRLLDMFEAALS